MRQDGAGVCAKSSHNHLLPSSQRGASAARPPLPRLAGVIPQTTSLQSTSGCTLHKLNRGGGDCIYTGTANLGLTPRGIEIFQFFSYSGRGSINIAMNSPAGFSEVVATLALFIFWIFFTHGPKEREKRQLDNHNFKYTCIQACKQHPLFLLPHHTVQGSSWVGVCILQVPVFNNLPLMCIDLPAYRPEGDLFGEIWSTSIGSPRSALFPHAPTI